MCVCVCVCVCVKDVHVTCLTQHESSPPATVAVNTSLGGCTDSGLGIRTSHPSVPAAVNMPVRIGAWGVGRGAATEFLNERECGHLDMTTRNEARTMSGSGPD